MKIDFSTVFSDSFETFKVFDNIRLSDIEDSRGACITSIWQTLNHLIIWQDYQLKKLEGLKLKAGLDEFETWIIRKQPNSQIELDDTVNKFHSQLALFKEVVIKLALYDNLLEEKLGILQESALHLSFHLGEVILSRRINGNYPLPHEMKSFLKG